MSIRKATLYDLGDLIKIYATAPDIETIPDELEIRKKRKAKGFERDGWLCFDENGKVVGEINTRIDMSPRFGKVGVITNIVVDYEYRSKGIGKSLMAAAEERFVEKGASRIFINAPVSIYNFFMKLGYFRYDQVIKVRSSLENLKSLRPRNFEMNELDLRKRLRPSTRLLNLGVPGQISEGITNMMSGMSKGKFFEFRKAGMFIGIGAIWNVDESTVQIAVDVDKHGLKYLPAIIVKTSKAAKDYGVSNIESYVSSRAMQYFYNAGKWTEENTDILILTKIIK